METQRLFLFISLSLVVLLMWEAWNRDNTPVISPNAIVNSRSDSAPAAPIEPRSTNMPATSVDAKADLPSASPQTELTAAPKEETTTKGSLKTGQRIRVMTDVLDVDIDTVGGDLRKAYLIKYPVSLEEPENAFPFMGDELPQLFIAQSGLLSKAGAPDHHAVYQSSEFKYQLGVGENEIRVPLTWTNAEGIMVTKTYVFKRDSYVIEVIHTVENQSGQAWTGRVYRQLQRGEYDELGKSRMIYTFTGAAVSTPDKPYEKIDFDEIGEWKAEQSYSKGGWVAMLQHYFVTAWIPGKDEANHIYTRNINNTSYSVGMTGSEQEVKAGESLDFTTQLYVGPKDQARLQDIEDNLKLTVDYGFLTFIAQPLFWLLQKIHEYVGNWGWSIIFVTIIIKLVFYKLSAASYRSMANMRKLAPKFQSIRERYGDDRQRMSQAMMELYKKEKANPFSGCWPMLVQIPVFISLYWVLLESVELRQAPFMLWIHDLSVKDPYYILPLLMGASMFIQHKISANPGLDPMQQKIMQYLPIIFTLFFMLFPAGLVLYWVVNNVLSITQQWYIMRKIENEPKRN
ncbi:MAG: membrane protein insertase YidC [Gammaproteobacteria bacterium]|nr:membrane protein insertase YidC [Gammaproteobacteria bacterium]MDH5727554.1 membrane protein insertase YidC [Gammaproteobacteria bacterium]